MSTALTHPPLSAPTFLSGRRLQKYRKLAFVCVFFFCGALINILLYSSTRERLSSLEPSLELQPIHSGILAIFIFNIILLLLITVPYVLLQLHFYHPIEIEEEISRQKISFLRMTEDALRTPIASMRWLAESLSQKGGLSGDDTHADQVQQMKDTIERLILQMNELLRVGQITRGFIQYTPAYMKIDSVILPALQAMQPLLQSKQQTITYKRSKHEESFYVDAPLISHVLQILIGNISELSPVGAPIIISLDILPDDVVISIMDAGKRSVTHHKTPQKILMSAFNMTVSYEIVKAAGGKLWFDEQDAGRAHCFVKLPRKNLPSGIKSMFDY